MPLPLYCQLKVLPLSLLIQIEYLCKDHVQIWEQIVTYATGHVDPYQTYHKYHKYQVCENYFKRLSHQHYTQFAQSNFEKVTITSAKEKFLLKYIGPNVWTNIPLNIKNSMSLKVFINSYRIHLIGNYTDS